ncbi:Cobyrinic acid ac-diamide synthase [Desulfamplus magnetovallimortis]|uniref:Cobyrinic acid ac-diamide synthase n=1 Tax=Desulfamplus magnetovallimortis TaxID=1246637 RepID=A0A1W1HC39_9BACT|nr:ParA family protein [Desulfamplus magnetovallimortis]SLM30061.1 Cobyrinic acid ac-diamide synthase [Desulfamplus magnetovallimortis]
MSSKIAIFSHKGGVSKTTTAYHLAWMLTEFDKKVLLVDSDSQCNLSKIALGEEGFDQFYLSKPDCNLKSYLSPAFKAQPVSIKAAELIPVKNNSNLFIIPGSFEITEYDVSLGVSFTLSETLTSLKNLPGSFNALIEKTVEAHAIDYVIIDMNPSLSAINQALLVSSDYFIVPAAPDNFSAMAVKSLSKTLPKWEQWAKKARVAFSDAFYPLPKNTPKFIGTVVQRYNIRDGKPTQANQKLIDELNQLITTLFVPEIKKIGMTLNDEQYDFENYCLSLLPDFQGLNPIYQKLGIPVYALTDEQIGQTGTVLKKYQTMRDDFYSKFSNFTKKVIELTS